VPRLDGLPHFAYEFLRIFQHQPGRNPKQADPELSQIILFRSVFPDLARLRMCAAIKLDRPSMLKTVEVNNAVLDAALAAKLRACPLGAQQMPCGLFTLSLALPQFAEALGWDTHRDSIAAFKKI
jgi:hypothetical protein